MRLWDLAPALHTDCELQQENQCAGCFHHSQDTWCPGGTGAAPYLPPSCPSASPLAALPGVTCLLSQTYSVFLCFHAFAHVLSPPSLLIDLNLAPDPNSKITSSMLSSLTCSAMLNTPCCGPLNLQTLSPGHPSLAHPPLCLPDGLLLNWKLFEGRDHVTDSTLYPQCSTQANQMLVEGRRGQRWKASPFKATDPNVNVLATISPYQKVPMGMGI